MSFAIGALLALLAVSLIGALAWCWFLGRALRGDSDIERG